MLLQVRGLEARYGRFLALSDVSLAVPAGSVVALIGPNGAGKTTLLRCVSGMIAPTQGSIVFDGERIDGASDHRIAAAGIVHVPEGRGVFPNLTVRENLTMAAHAVGTRDVSVVFDLFPVLASRQTQLAGTLSGGEQQMLALGRAVLRRPRLLMADELSLGLAPIVVQQLFDVLRTIRDAGSTILLVEQYLRHALALADIVVVLQKGRVRFIGDAGELSASTDVAAAYLGQGAGGALSDSPSPPHSHPPRRTSRRTSTIRRSGR